MRLDAPHKPLAGLAEVLTISAPASLSMLNSTIMRFVDGLMVSRTGPAALSAQFIGGMSAFVPHTLALGILSLANTYVSQNFGAGRPRRCGQYAWAGIFLALILGGALLPLTAVAGPLFGWIGHEEAALEAMYFRYMLITGVFFLASRATEQFFYGIHRPRTVYVVSLLGNAMNIFLNWVLIYGHFGFAAMGLEGAAIGTLISAVAMLGTLLVLFLGRKYARDFGTRSIRSVTRKQVWDLFRIGWPAGLQLTNDIFTWLLLSLLLVGPFGQAHRVAAAAVIRYMSLAFMPSIGVGIAATALVGRYIGARKPDIARSRAYTAVAVGLAYSFLCGAVMLIFRVALLEFFINVQEATGAAAEQTTVQSADRVIRIGASLMICGVIYQCFNAVALIFVRALRGAGDTVWPMLLTALLAWGILVGGGLMMVHVWPELESLGPWIAVCVYGAVLAAVMARRFMGGRWQELQLIEKDEPPTAALAEAVAEVRPPFARTAPPVRRTQRDSS